MHWHEWNTKIFVHFMFKYLKYVIKLHGTQSIMGQQQWHKLNKVPFTEYLKFVHILWFMTMIWGYSCGKSSEKFNDSTLLCRGREVKVPVRWVLEMWQCERYKTKFKNSIDEGGSWEQRGVSLSLDDKMGKGSTPHKSGPKITIKCKAPQKKFKKLDRNLRKT